jgi:hypothetical protein
LIGAIATHIIPLPIKSESLLVLLAVLYFLFVGIVLALIALRFSTYPSDRYRATHYGVIDVVEFIRQLERAVIRAVITELEQQSEGPKEKYSSIRDIEEINKIVENINEDKLSKKKRIRLSFISHSLGCEVVTQTIRILSDVFDPNLREQDKPSSHIGGVFKLGRIVLVAPDIPVESILSSRSNFLKSALRRCEEAYAFSNEADLALRLASTAANYFSFPSRSRFRGYKLGNITVKHSSDRNKRNLPNQYGIINLDRNQDFQPHENLEIRASDIERITIAELTEEKNKEIKRSLQEETVADFLTYFDCTDYVEPGIKDPKRKGIVSYAQQKLALKIWFDYIYLSFAFFLGIPRRIDVHGGYFEGEFSQKLIYDLAFLGYQELLNSYKDSENDFSVACQNKGIQVVRRSTPLPNEP